MDDKTLKETIKTLNKIRKTGRIAERTVVRWKSSIYNYAAIYTGGKWWITGTGRWYGGNVVFTAEQFTEIIKTAEKVEIATSWADIDG